MRGYGIGGQIRIGKVPPHRNELRKVTDYLISQVKKFGVSIELGKEIIPEMIENLNANKILIATGSVALIPAIEGMNRTGIVSALEFLAGSTSVGNRVAIVGAGTGRIINC